ncbi:hypothetical protein [Embleya scabrispora]|uniref:hypothetical protein n=1 Tax=Embleya scabrispora TaxID=159449 RepID=UPI0003809195|nr:hypothetical protein [Embleya scabrispora]MYS80485.1 hypothetical protein [Streptomyces sp. SID5474]
MSTGTVFRNLTCAVAATLCLAVAVPVAAADEVGVASGRSASAPTRPEAVA